MKHHSLHSVFSLITEACALFSGTSESIPASMSEWAARGNRAIYCSDRQHHIAWNRTGGFPMIVGPAPTAAQQEQWEPIKVALLKKAQAEGVRIKAGLI